MKTKTKLKRENRKLHGLTEYRLRFDKVIESLKVGTFLRHSVV